MGLIKGTQSYNNFIKMNMNVDLNSIKHRNDHSKKNQ